MQVKLVPCYFLINQLQSAYQIFTIRASVCMRNADNMVEMKCLKAFYIQCYFKELPFPANADIFVPVFEYFFPINDFLAGAT